MDISGIKYEKCEGVYEPAEDTYLLLGNVKCGKQVLEIGSGCGLISVKCALGGSSVDAVDINPEAVRCTLKNAGANGVKINAIRSDLFSEVPQVKKYHTIIFNPPYLPTDDRIEGSEQWDGGSDGFRLTRPFLEEAPGHLEEGGEIYILISSLTDNEALVSRFSNLRFEKLAETGFFFEKLFVWRITSI